MTQRPTSTGPSFAGLVITEVMVVFFIFIGAIIAVKLNAISLQDLQEYFG